MASDELWKLLQNQGYELEVVAYDEWYEKVKSATEDNGKLANVLYLLDTLVKSPDYFNRISTYKQDNLFMKLEDLQLEYPPLDDTLMRKYLNMLPEVGIIPYPESKSRQNRSHQLHGKVVLVTGASSGIGEAIAEKLSLAGAKVAIAARRTEKLQDLKERIEKQGGIALPVTLDVCDVKQVQDGVQKIESLLGPVDILVNNAGVLYYTMMKNLHLKEWHQMVDVNVKGVLNCVGAVLGTMIQRKEGHIVNISSDGGRRGFPGVSVYCGTKFFIEGMSQSMRHEVAEFGIKITCIQPGDVKTELFQNTIDAEAQEKYVMVNKMKVLDPKDIAGAVLYAVTQPDYCAVNEILVEPRDAPI